MKMKEIRAMGKEELAAKAREMAEELFKLKFQHSIRPLENTAKMGALRKDIARIKTLLNASREQ